MGLISNSDHTKVTFDKTSIIGLIIWMICILYSSLRSASAVASVVQDPEKQGKLFTSIKKHLYWERSHKT
jgi:hypothetical protein